MTTPAFPAGLDVSSLTRLGLTATATARWPESTADAAPAPLPGFIESEFAPLLAAVSERALDRRPDPGPGQVTGIVMITTFGDVTSAVRVADAVDGGRRLSPLFFFQSVPNTVAGHVAARRNLTGPVVCVGGVEAGLEIAAQLVEDGDADDVLVVAVDVAGFEDTESAEDADGGAGTGRATALVVTAAPGPAARP